MRYSGKFSINGQQLGGLDDFRLDTERRFAQAAGVPSSMFGALGGVAAAASCASRAMKDLQQLAYEEMVRSGYLYPPPRREDYPEGQAGLISFLKVKHGIEFHPSKLRHATDAEFRVITRKESNG